MLTLKRIQSLSQPHLAIYDEKLYELTTPQYEILETRVMNGVEANRLASLLDLHPVDIRVSLPSLKCFM